MFPLETIERPPAAVELPRLPRVIEVDKEDPEDHAEEERGSAGPDEGESSSAHAAGQEAGGPVRRRRSKSPTRGLRIDLLL